MKNSLFIIAVLFACFSAIANAEILKISTLESDEEIRIEFSSQGCFHNTKFFYVLRGGSTKFLDVTQAKSEWNAEKKEMVDLGVVPIGTVALQVEDVNGLDHLFSFYRMKSDGGCTTIDHLKVEYIRAGKIIGEEKITDSSCAVSMISMMKADEGYRKRVGDPENWAFLKQIVTFNELTARIKP
ncbi:MAG: hypothetical protein H7Y42_10625 [Chitinophagaceae bacterium]|nr:hypothetical protein [Chitinophagaceae bacterium]